MSNITPFGEGGGMFSCDSSFGAERAALRILEGAPRPRPRPRRSSGELIPTMPLRGHLGKECCWKANEFAGNAMTEKAMSDLGMIIFGLS